MTKKQLTIMLTRRIPTHRAVILDRPTQEPVTVPFVEVDSESTPDALAEVLVRLAQTTDQPYRAGNGVLGLHCDLWEVGRINLPDRPLLGEYDNAEEIAAAYAATICKIYKEGRDRLVRAREFVPQALETFDTSKNFHYTEFSFEGKGFWDQAEVKKLGGEAFGDWEKRRAVAREKQEHEEALARREREERETKEKLTKNAVWASLVREAGLEKYGPDFGKQLDEGLYAPNSNDAVVLVRGHIWPDIPVKSKPQLTSNDECEHDRQYEKEEAITHLTPARWAALESYRFRFSQSPTYGGEWILEVVRRKVICQASYCEESNQDIVLRVTWTFVGRKIERYHPLD